MTVHLKVIVEQSDTQCGCRCASSYYNVAENNAAAEDSSPDWRQSLRAVNELIQVLKDFYGDRLDISVVNPRSIRAFWDNIRYKVRPFVPVWILDRKKICEGLPDLAELRKTIDGKM
ncbi:MAG: hypothetical protein LBR71_05055 [Synergistaceae bacterium]|jgi:hypothetical protein|nr:hypothetical protein [Synergistaceae bacterium]